MKTSIELLAKISAVLAEHDLNLIGHGVNIKTGELIIRAVPPPAPKPIKPPKPNERDAADPRGYDLDHLNMDA